MAESPDALIDICLSDQWRVHGGPRKKSAREELRDLLIPIVIKAFGSMETSLNVLLKESPHSNGHRISALIRAYQLYFLRRRREAVEAHDEAAEKRCADYERQFGELDKYETEKFGLSTSDDEKISAILRTSVCNLSSPSECGPEVDRSQGPSGPTTRPGEPLFENLPGDDPRHIHLVPFFEMMDKFQMLAEEYPALCVEWWAEDGKWLSWPPPSRAVREQENCPSSPGCDLQIAASAGEAASRLLKSPESWLDSTLDPWLDIKNKAPWELWFYAIREFWLDAEEEAKDAGANMQEFAKAAEEDGYRITQNYAVGKRIWRQMVRSKQSLHDSRQELGLSASDDIGRYEDPAGWIQTGRIKHLFRACVYFLRSARGAASPRVGENHCSRVRRRCRYPHSNQRPRRCVLRD